MKSKIAMLILFCQFCFGQTIARKPLHGLVQNDSISIENGYVFNVNSKTRTFISSQGFFDILAKTNDTLLFSSLGLKSKKIILSDKDLSTSLLVINLNTFINQLDEVVVKKIVVKPNLGKIQAIIDTKYIDDKQSSPINRTMPVLGIENGMDFIRIGEMIGKLFVKEKPEKEKVLVYGNFSEIVPRRINHSFFTNTLNLKEDEIGLFFIFCENDSKSKNLLNPKSEFELIDFLITKNREFKTITVFEKQ